MERPEFCKEAEDQGGCRALIPRWFYDFTTSTCSLFIYGGCEGNSNNFESKADCLQTCSGVA
uniref:BPTI/Kunitz inhibitor domain-containing protein n=1 Tax=Sarcophilus harrisii TaxID=9305 RepID=A0A7N4P7H5_SARHA